MTFVVLKCPYCGGKLVAKEDRYFCVCCDNEVIYRPDSTSNKRQSSVCEEIGVEYRFKIHLIHIDLDVKFDFYNDVRIDTTYRKRVTLADRFPMEMTVYLDGKKAYVINNFENVGKGCFSLTQRGGIVSLDNVCGFQLSVNGLECSTFTELNHGDVIELGDAIFTISDGQS
jgi:hypothetical protein